MAMDTNSPNYCRSKGEQIALNVDGTTYEETNTYSAYVFIFTAKICVNCPHQFLSYLINIILFLFTIKC